MRRPLVCFVLFCSDGFCRPGWGRGGVNYGKEKELGEGLKRTGSGVEIQREIRGHKEGQLSGVWDEGNQIFVTETEVICLW